MPPPCISYVTYNRMGLTAKNLQSILDTTEDFEMHIVDSNSKDDTWEFIESVKDDRIKSKTRLPVNCGPIYALNFNLTRRRPDQYFITLDTDVNMKTKDWISRFMKVFDTFPEVGVLGVIRARPYYQVYPPVIPKSREGVSFLELRNGKVDEVLDFVHGCCMCLRPELIKEIGYWSEENGYGDAELSPRVNNYTSFRVGFMTDIEYNPVVDFSMEQSISCDDCTVRDYCRLDKKKTTCFKLRDDQYKNESFADKFKWKYLETFKELEEGKRTAYCGSIFDLASKEKSLYHQDWVLENFLYYMENSI